MSGMTSRWFLGIAVGGAIALGANSASAQQITPDATLGSENSRVTSTEAVDQINGGAIRGTNLLHSFQEFNVNSGRSALFTNPPGIENILSRVTGTNPSNILGTLGVSGGNANLFLINPNGIVFGPNASLSVGGSFVGTTANAIQFGDRGFFSATNPEAPSPLLTINPSALLFNQSAASLIQNNSVAAAGKDPAGFDTFGLRVPDGKSLLLVGGNINMNGGQLNAYGGRVELSGLAASGNVGLNVDGDKLSLDFPASSTRADISLTNGAAVYVEAANGGDIAVNARNLEVTRSVLSAGIAQGLGNAGAKAGDITLNAIGDVKLDGSSIFNYIERQATGKGGNINITTGTLSLTNGTQLDTSTFGRGDAGSVNINARDTVSFDRAIAFSDVLPEGVGKGGNINITTGTLSLTNRAQLYASTSGRGDAGSVNINARDTVSFDGAASAFSSVEFGGVGNGGNIKITTGTLSLSNNAGLIARMRGQGDGGNINIKANQLTLSSDALIQGDLDITGNGRGADINLNVTGQILLTGSETQQRESTRITLGSLPGGVGSAGNLTIHAGSLVLKDGGFIKNSSQAQNGSAGNIEVYADQVNISGTGSSSGLSSGLFTSTISGKNAGNITINTGTFYIADGAALSARTTRDGQGGNITVNASRSFAAVNGGQLVTTTSGNGNAGSIVVSAKERVTISGKDPNYFKRSDLIDQIQNNFSPSDVALIANNIKEDSASGLFASTVAGSTGQGGNLIIETPTLQVENGAKVTVSSLQGQAGNLTVAAKDIRLNQGNLTAQTAITRDEKGANIKLQGVDLLLLQNQSLISAQAFDNGSGGNIEIDAKNGVVAAVPDQNNDIIANAFQGSGGKITITTLGIFGITQRNSDPPNTTNDIDASSQFNNPGTVIIITPDIDPSRGLVQLPTVVVDPPRLIASGCAAFDSGGSSFTVTGRGGLPSSPDEFLSTDVVWTDARSPATTVQPSANKPTAKPDSKSKTEPIAIVPATGWVFNKDKGEVTLISSTPSAKMGTTPATCPSSSGK